MLITDIGTDSNIYCQTNRNLNGDRNSRTKYFFIRGRSVTFAARLKIFPVVAHYIETLNDAQREAVVNFNAPSLIVAGAGSGKTRVLTCRIAYMLEQGVAPHSILALTFTNKAAREMRERIGALVSSQLSRYLWMGTFHSIFARILRAEADKLGFPSSFTIYDTADCKNVIKSIIKELNLNDETYKVGDLASRISLAKNNLVTPEAYEANTSYIAEDRERRRPQFAQVYKLYVHKCKEFGAMDFDDLLLYINILFRDFPDVLKKYQQQFRYILVDEYQDTNYAQYIIIRRLAQAHANVCVVGDDAQSIYSFRGAKIENILRFRNDFPNAQVFKLERNYRSTQTIVNAANSVIGKNKRQIKKEVFSREEIGEPIKVLRAYTDQEEAALIASDVWAKVMATHTEYSEFAILYRTNAQSRVLEEALRKRNIPYKIYGGMSFYQRKEIKDLVAYIRLVVNPRDDEAFRRIINYPARGIGDVTVGRIAEAAARRELSLWDALNTLDPAEMALHGSAAKKVADFTAMIRTLSDAKATSDAYRLGLEIATRSGILGSFKVQQTPEAMSAVDNIEELLNSIQAFAEEHAERDPEAGPVTIEEWLQNIALLTDADNEKPEERNKVTLMTVHAAKGLEFKYVYIAGLEENLFPSLMSMNGEEGLEEERRLFYVALTRAKTAAVLSFAQQRFKWGEMTFSQPSRFLKEIDPRYLDVAFDLGEDDEEETDSMPAGSARYSSRTAYGSSDRHETRRTASGQNRPFYGRSERNERPTDGRSVYQARTDVSAGRSNGSSMYGRQAITPGSSQSNPTPQVGLGTRFKSVGRRPAENKGSVPSESGLASSGAATSSAVGGELAVGVRVEHDKFGCGRVTAIEMLAGDQKITVEFDGAGRKTLLRKFAKLRVIG